MARLFSRQLQRNIGFNVALQAATYVIPLVSVPHLLHHLGPHQFGALSIAQALVQYLCVLVEYGHSLTVTRQVALARDNPVQLAKLFWTTIAVRGIVGCVALLAFVSILPLIVGPADDVRVYWWVFLNVVGIILLPAWFFQGLERFQTLVLVQIASRTILVAGILLLVRTPDDCVLTAALIGVQGFLTGLCLFLAALPLVRGSPIAISLQGIGESFREGFHIFVMNVSVTFFTSGSPFIVGLVSSPEMVAYFALGEKIIRCIYTLMTAVAQAAYPQVARLADTSHASARSLVLRLLAYSGSAAAVVSLTIIASADWLVVVLGGAAFLPASTALRVLAIMPMLSAVNNVIGTSGLCSMGSGAIMSRYVTPIAFFSAPWIALLAYAFGATGAAAGVVSTEFMIAVFVIQIYRTRVVAPGISTAVEPAAPLQPIADPNEVVELQCASAPISRSPS